MYKRHNGFSPVYVVDVVLPRAVDPSATELLALFLYQADLASTSLTDAPNNGDILHASSPSQTRECNWLHLSDT